MAPEHVGRLLHDGVAAGAIVAIVGLTMTAYMPWEVIATRNLLRMLTGARVII